MGSSPRRVCPVSSPRMTTAKVETPTMVMYSLVRGKIALYFFMVLDMADWFSADADLDARDLAPDADLRLELSSDERLALLFFLRCLCLDAPPRMLRISSIDEDEDDK